MRVCRRARGRNRRSRGRVASGSRRRARPACGRRVRRALPRDRDRYPRRRALRSHRTADRDRATPPRSRRAVNLNGRVRRLEAAARDLMARRGCRTHRRPTGRTARGVGRSLSHPRETRRKARPAEDPCAHARSLSSLRVYASENHLCRVVAQRFDRHYPISCDLWINGTHESTARLADRCVCRWCARRPGCTQRQPRSERWNSPKARGFGLISIQICSRLSNGSFERLLDD
jgi:hypothetical protein